MDDTPRSDNASPAGSDSGSIRKRPGSHGSREGSGKVTFPNSSKSVVEYQIPKGNPFTMPPENDIFMLRDKERQRKKQERNKQRHMKVHEKTTYASRVNCKTASMIHPADDENQKTGDEELDKRVAKIQDDSHTLAVTRDRHVEKESLADYISKKREMFLVQYSLGVKRDEMRKLEEITAAEERKLELAEQYLEEDAAMFDEFLKENDKNSVDAIKKAEEETRLKQDKVMEIKKIMAQMMSIKSEISKYEELLKEYQMYKEFLDSLTPKEWLDERNEKHAKLQEKRKKEQEENEKNLAKSKGSKLGMKLGAKSTQSKESSVVSVIEDDDDPELYFSDTQQLLNIFAELEEQNLSLIQNSQETEEALEEMKQNIKQTKIKMEKETQVLKDQIDKLNSAINKEEKKAADLEIKARMFSFGEFKAEDQEKMLEALNSKVEQVYNNCIGDNEANISTLQMLTNIENRLEELFEMIEMMPQDKVEAAEKTKDKERRLKLREEKIEQQRLHQEERVKKALERAQAAPKRQTGRKLVFRSEPPQRLMAEDDSANQASREEEELAYYFT